MSLSITGLVLAYLLIVFLLLVAVLRSDLGVPAKFALIIVAGVFCWIHFQSLVATLGWPVETRLPARFEMVAVLVDEPDHRRDSDGSIYLWLRDLEDAHARPRAFRTPYDKTLHLRIDEVLEKQKQGERFVGSASASTDSSAAAGIEFKILGKNQNYLKPEGE